MKVLLVSPLPPPAGGIATWTKNLLDYSLNKSLGYEIIHQNTASTLKEITKVDYWSRIYYGIRESKRIIDDLKKNIKRYKPDIIHLTSSASLALIKDYFIIRLAKNNKIPVVVHWRIGRIPNLAVNKNWEWNLLCKITRGSNTAIVIDIQSYNCLLHAGFNNIVKIPNPLGLDVEEQINSKTAVNIQKKPGCIVFVGHLIKKKGVYELVEACSQLSLIKELTLIGLCESKVRKELIDLANKRDNGKWLKIAGALDIDHVYQLMLSSPLLALPSYTEGFPNVVMEAMAMECAVIATDIGAIPEILAVSSDMPCGICVPVKNLAKLKDAILSLLEDPDRVRALGKNGRERVMRNFTFNQVMGQYISVWNKACIR